MTGQRDEQCSAAPLTTILCSGSDCAKEERAAYRALSACLHDVGASIVKSKCLDVCHGPVVVVTDADGRATVIEKIRTKERRKQLAEAIASGQPDKVARSASAVAKGKRHSKALRKAGRVAGRELSAHSPSPT